RLVGNGLLAVPVDVLGRCRVNQDGVRPGVEDPALLRQLVRGVAVRPEDGSEVEGVDVVAGDQVGREDLIPDLLQTGGDGDLAVTDPLVTDEPDELLGGHREHQSGFVRFDIQYEIAARHRSSYRVVRKVTA